MSDTQVGGNGSVHWLVNADDVFPGAEHTSLLRSRRKSPQRPREFQQHGVDAHGKPTPSGSNFVIRIKVPKAGRNALLNQLQAGSANFQPIPGGGGEYLEFTLEIDTSDKQKAHTQIQISWGKREVWTDGLATISTEVKDGVADAASVASAGGGAATSSSV